MHFRNPLRQYDFQINLSSTLDYSLDLYRHKKTKEQVVIKSGALELSEMQLHPVSKRRKSADRFPEFQLHSALSQCRHPHLIQLHDTLTYKNRFYFAMEYTYSEDLQEKVLSPVKLSDVEVQHYFSQLVSGISFIHALGYAHGNISLENILVDESNQCRVGDFGLASSLSAPFKKATGKFKYLAPEIVKESTYAPQQTDMWSLGIILYAILSGKLPFNKADREDDHFQIFRESGIESLLLRQGITRRIPADALDLLTRLLTVNPKARIEMNELINHRWIQSHYLYTKEELSPESFPERVVTAFRDMYRKIGRSSKHSERRAPQGTMSIEADRNPSTIAA